MHFLNLGGKWLICEKHTFVQMFKFTRVHACNKVYLTAHKQNKDDWAKVPVFNVSIFLSATL